jgi:hypothetical protein
MQHCLSILFAVLLCFIKPVFAQQNLFNIPSCDITPSGKFFYQHQFNLYTSKVESKAHLVYGLGKGWDVGMNLVGKGFYFTPEWRSLHNSDPTKGALYPVLMATIQKSLVLNEHWQFNLGSQAGVNLSKKLEKKELNYFFYSLTAWKPGHDHRFKFLLGPYYTTTMFVGEGNRAGILAGYEIKVAEKWYLMGDFISGNNDAAVSVFGLMRTLSKRIQVCGGYMLANPKTPKPNGVVLELNILGWDFDQ